jgi:glycosyltransferase involved in cell wall biosynthesis
VALFRGAGTGAITIPGLVRVAFLTQDLQLSGGVGVVVEHANRLAADHGFDVTLVLTGRETDSAWAFDGLEHLHVVPLEAALDQQYDVAVSTWWETARALFDLTAVRYATFVQSFENRFYDSWDPRRIAATLAIDLPVRHLTEARWIADALDAMHPGHRALYVRNGIAKDIFAGPAHVEPALHGPLRIVIEGSRATSFKGVDQALAAANSMTEEGHVTLVAPDGSGAGAAADRVLERRSQRAMAELYAESHVVLKLSRVEGMFGPPLEGFHMGATCVVAPVTGYDEYVRHRHNGLVVDWDDPRGTARALDLLARDRALLHYLRANALATARAWPSWRQQSAVMAAALRTIVRDPPTPARAIGHRLSRDVDGALGHAERQLVNHNLVRDQLAAVRLSRTYRGSVRMRNIARRLAAPLRRLRR